MPVSRSFLKGPLYLLGLALGLTLAGHALASDSLPTNRLIVKFRNAPAAMAQSSAAPTVSAAALDEMSSRLGVKLQAVRRMATGANVLRLPRFMTYADAQAYARKLQADPNVLYAEPDGRRRPTMTAPNVQYWAQQYDLQAAPGGIDMLDAWDYTTGSTNVNVAVIDTGILPHPDLQGRILPGYDFISNAAWANDNQPATPDPTYGSRDPDPTDPGDWVSQADIDNDPADFSGCSVEPSSWHGTHVSGTIAANPNNTAGIAGINWKSGIVPVRVLGKCGGWDSDITDGMLWANGLQVAGALSNANPARVLNLSLGGSSPSCPQSYQDAINRIVANGGIVVVAAGNDGSDASQSTPANCQNVITVGAIGPGGDIAYYSNYGANITLMAPGGDDTAQLWSTWNDGATTAGNMVYGQMMGTSMATPHVTGVVSLMLSLNPLLTYTDVVSKLKASVTPFPAGSYCATHPVSSTNPTSVCGAGILNAANALRSVSPLSVSAGANQTVSNSQSVTLSGAAAYGTVTPTSGITYQWAQTSGPNVTLANANAATATFTAPALSTTLGFQLTATDLYGNTNSSNVTVTVIQGLPVLTVPSVEAVNVGNALSFTVSATNGATLAASSLPAGATFDPAIGQFNWPSAGPASTYQVQFTATNANGTASSSVTVNVKAQLTNNSVPGPGSSGGGGGGGGGGCTINPKAPFDPLLPTLLTGALLMQVRRQRRKNRH